MKKQENNLKKTSYQVVLYSIGNILLKIVGLLLLPLYTSVFRISEFGMIGIIETTILLLTTVLSFNLSSALVRWLSDENDLKTEKSIVFTILSLNVALIAVFSIFAFPFSTSISKLFFQTGIYKNVIILMFLSVYIDIINRIPLNLIRIREKPVLYSISMIIKSIVTLATNIVLLKYTNLGIQAVLIGGIAGNVAFFACSAYLLYKNLHFHFLKSEVSGIIKYSFPLIFVGLGSILLSLGDRYVLSALKDFGQVGVYTMAYKVSSIVNLFVLQAVNLAVLPIVLKSFNSETGKQFIKKIMQYLTVVLSVMFLIISFYSENVLNIFSKSQDYLTAVDIIPILLFAYIFDGIRIMYSYHILYVKKTQWNAWLTLGSAILNITLNIIFIPRFGYTGAAFTTLFSSIITFFAYKMISDSLLYIDYNIKKIFIPILLSLILYLSYSVSNFVNIIKTISSVVYILLFVFVLSFLKIISISDFKKLDK